MTKPLIEQLAERAGLKPFTVSAEPWERNLSEQQKLFFELCARGC